MGQAYSHTPVLLKECIKLINPSDGGVYYDGTLGLGGHAEQLLKQSAPSGRLIATDKDIDAIKYAEQRLSGYKNRLSIYHSDFVKLGELVVKEQLPKFDGAILDLGISSYQIDNADRGFSYMNDAPLDMRMDRSQQLSAYAVVNGYPPKELSRIIREYGEEPFFKRITEAIINARAESPIMSTVQLARIIEQSVHGYGAGHPAKKTFMALRIEVNKELDIIDKAITAVMDNMNTGGVLAVISFNSLEDRIVKTAFRRMSISCTCPKNFPICVCNGVAKARVLTDKPITASEAEVWQNRRSAPAKLRAAVKL